MDAARIGAQRPAAQGLLPAAPEPPATAVPSGPGLIVQIYGRHYHNARTRPTAQYVRDTLITTLAGKEMHDMGVSYPVLIKPEHPGPEKIVIPSPKHGGNDDGSARGDGGFAGHGRAAA